LTTATVDEQAIADRLRTDTAYYARHCIKIIDQRERIVPLEPKPAQLQLEAAFRKQEAEGRPLRAIILKARKEGISTWMAAKSVQRFTQRANHRALVVAHDKKTAGELYGIAETAYANLPDRTIGDLVLKPPVVSSQRATEIRLGERSRVARLEGQMGLNSTYRVDTANEFEAGRGFTYGTLHLSEIAFWAETGATKKLTALLNTVPDEPGTLIAIESTANGWNIFRRLWVDAMEGRSDYAAVFIPWYDDPQYVREFIDEDEREAFFHEIGTGPYGDAEPDLVAKGVSLEQLAWRRWAIANRTQGDLRIFQQEYPATWEEAFLATGRQVFSPQLVSNVMSRCEAVDPVEGIIKPQSKELVERGTRTVEILKDPLWVPREQAQTRVGERFWHVWELPDKETPPGQYIVFVDPASGMETESGDPDYFAICVIDHRTLKQVAQFTARKIDPLQVADEAIMAAILYNDAWLNVETTGGYGLSFIRRWWRDYRYGKIYRRKPQGTSHEKQERRYGWSTDVATKPLMVDHARELLRIGKDGILSRRIANEMLTYVKDEKGRYGAEVDAHDDALMAWMGAQITASEKPVRPHRKPGERVTTTPRMGSRVSMNSRASSYLVR
jgi:hypothetical protein